MSKESERLRGRAANSLRDSRRTNNPALKSIHTGRAASLKAMARNEEWLSGEPDRSKPKSPSVKSLDDDRRAAAIKRKKP